MKLSIAKNLITIVLLVVISLIAIPAIAQDSGENPPVPVYPEIPNPPQTEAEFEAWSSARLEAKRAYLTSLSITDLHVVSLVSGEAASFPERLSPNLLVESLGAIVATSWADVQKVSQERQIDVLIVYGEAAKLTDLEWMQDAYRSGTIIVGVNVPFETLVELTGDQCLKEPNPGYEAYFPNRYLYFTFSVRSDLDSVKDAVTSSELEACESAKNLPGRIDIYHGTVYRPITTDDWREILISDLLSDYAQYTFWHKYPEWYRATSTRG